MEPTFCGWGSIPDVGHLWGLVALSAVALWHWQLEITWDCIGAIKLRTCIKLGAICSWKCPTSSRWNFTDSSLFRTYCFRKFQVTTQHTEYPSLFSTSQMRVWGCEPFCGVHLIGKTFFSWHGGFSCFYFLICHHQIKVSRYIAVLLLEHSIPRTLGSGFWDRHDFTETKFTGLSDPPSELFPLEWRSIII